MERGIEELYKKFAMNILVAAYKFGTEEEIGAHLGTYHYFIEKMRRTVKRGHRVVVVAPWLSLMRRGSTGFDGIEIVRYWPPLAAQWWLRPLSPIVRALYIRQTQRMVLKTVTDIRADVVYVWQARETGHAVAQIKDKLPCPFIFRQITAWKWHFERGLRDVRTHKAYARAIYRLADKVVFLSEAAVREAEEFGFDRSKAEVLGVAIDEDLFKPMNVSAEEVGFKRAPTILFIGRVNFAEKGIGVLLEAMPPVKEKIPDVNLAIIGGGEMERVQGLVKTLGIERYVQALGKKPFHELPKFINASEVFVTPSLWMEAFGQVTIEAMACGVPVVTSDAGASPEINIDGETGIVVPTGDIKALAQAIVRLLSDQALREKMGEAARKRVERQYTYEVMVGKFLNIVESTKV